MAEASLRHDQCEVQEVSADTGQWRKIARFLAGMDTHQRSEEYWYSNLCFWWQQNPCYQEGMPRGWILLASPGVVGLFGVIATEYWYQQQRYPALNGTTWVVHQEYRHQSLALFSRFSACKQQYILFDATPTPRVEKILQRFGFKSAGNTVNAVLPLALAGPRNVRHLPVLLLQRMYGACLPRIECRRITPEELSGLSFPDAVPPGYITKHRSPAYLHWYCFSTYPKELVGCFNAHNELSSFVVVMRHWVRSRIPVLRIVDYASTDPTGTQLWGVINAICRQPDLVAGSADCRFLIFSSFLNNPRGPRIPFFILRRHKHEGHYLTLPGQLLGGSMLHYIAEGDIGMYRSSP